MCPIGKVYESALPKLLLIKSETVIEVLSNQKEHDLSEKAQNLFNSISNFSEISFIDIIKLFGKESINLIDELAINNNVKIKEEIYDSYRPKTENVFQLNYDLINNLDFSNLRSDNHKNIISFFFPKLTTTLKPIEILLNSFGLKE